MEHQPLGYLVTPSTPMSYRVLCDVRHQNLSFDENSLVYARYWVRRRGEGVIPVEVLGHTGSITLENQCLNSPLRQVILSSFGDEASDQGETDQRYLEVIPIGCINLESGEPLEVGIPNSGTKFYFAEPNQVEAYYRCRDYIFRFGYLNGTNIPIGLDVRHFGCGTGGWGDARMIGVAGRSGSGKTVLLGQLIGAYARHREMGILILDPQGQYSSCNSYGQYTGELSKNARSWSWKLRRCFEQVGRIRDVRVISNEEINFGNDVGIFLELLSHYKFWEAVRPGIKTEKVQLASMRLREYLETLIEGKGRLEAVQWNNELERLVVEMIAQGYAKPEEEQERMLQRLAESGRMSEEVSRLWNRAKAYFSQGSRPYEMEQLVDDVLTRHQIIIFNNDYDQEYIQDLFHEKLLLTLKVRAQRLYYQSRRLGVETNVNALVVMDEAQRLIPEHPEQPIRERILMLMKDAVNTGRKLGLGWIFATQSVVNISKAIWRQVGTTFVGYGFGVGADKQRLLEMVGNQSQLIKKYESMPQPLQTGRYWFMVQGELVALGNGNQSLFIDCFSSQDEMFEVNATFYGNLEKPV